MKSPHLSVLFNRGQIVLICILVIQFFTLTAAYAGPPYKIGLAVWTGYPDSVRGFKDGLAAAGLVEGDSLSFMLGEPGADKTLQRTVAESFKAAKVDLVYTLTTPGTTIIKEVMPPETPIVFSIVTYPADSGLIESFEYSGNNLVGPSNYVPLRHHMNLLKLILPDVSKVAIFHRKGEPNSKIQAASLTRLLKRATIEVIDQEAADIDQLRKMAQSLAGKVDAFITTTDTLMQSGGEQVLTEISLRHKIPILSSNKAGIEKGSSFGPVVDFYALGKISGTKAAQILLEGVKPDQLESEMQDPPLFLANRNSIQVLGIELSPAALARIQWTN